MPIDSAHRPHARAIPQQHFEAIAALIAPHLRQVNAANWHESWPKNPRTKTHIWAQARSVVSASRRRGSSTATAAQCGLAIVRDDAEADGFGPVSDSAMVSEGGSADSRRLRRSQQAKVVRLS